MGLHDIMDIIVEMQFSRVLSSSCLVLANSSGDKGKAAAVVVLDTSRHTSKTVNTVYANCLLESIVLYIERYEFCFRQRSRLPRNL